MEKQERVMAYTMARALDHNELAEVSGGSFHMTTSRTLRASSANSQNLDVFIDVTIDW